MALTTAAVVGTVAAVKGGMDQKDAAKDAARAQTRASHDANKVQWDIYNQSRTDNEPFRQNALTSQDMFMQMMGLQPYSMNTGGGAQVQPQQPPSGGGLAGLLGDGRARTAFREGGGLGTRMIAGQVSGGPSPTGTNTGPAMNTGGPGQVSGGPAAGGNFQQTAFDLWRNTPGYQFNLDEGRKGLESSAAARGGLYSGAALKDMNMFSQNYADRTYGDYMNRLAAVAGMGQTANAQNAQMGANYANQYGINTTNAANARASGLQNRANANSDMWGNIAGIGGWFAGQYANRPPATGGSGYTGFNNTPGGGGFGWLGGG